MLGETEDERIREMASAHRPLDLFSCGVADRGENIRPLTALKVICQQNFFIFFSNFCVTRSAREVRSCRCLVGSSAFPIFSFTVGTQVPKEGTRYPTVLKDESSPRHYDICCLILQRGIRRH